MPESDLKFPVHFQGEWSGMGFCGCSVCAHDDAVWSAFLPFLIKSWPGVRVESSTWSCHMLEQWCLGVSAALSAVGRSHLAGEISLLADVLRTIRFQLESEASGLPDDDCWADLWLMSASAERYQDSQMSLGL